MNKTGKERQGEDAGKGLVGRGKGLVGIGKGPIG
jgi:hypothetical protein